jgi:hypothetical protein
MGLRSILVKFETDEDVKELLKKIRDYEERQGHKYTSFYGIYPNYYIEYRNKQWAPLSFDGSSVIDAVIIKGGYTVLWLDNLPTDDEGSIKGAKYTPKDWSGF